MKLIGVGKKLSIAAADLLLGVNCIACGQAGLWLCNDCKVATQTSINPQHWQLAGLDAWALTSYQWPWDELLIAHKDHGAWQLAVFLAEQLAKAVELFEACKPAPILVPVPSHPAAVRQRGYDHAWELTRRVARAKEMGCTQLLKKVQALPKVDQTELGRAGRFASQRHSMRACGVPDSRPILLVDDIVTTGASSQEAIRALQAGGYQVLGVAAICRTNNRYQR